ncbi:MAG: hypothetical protein A3C70_00650 [Candidatus Zambryskibacteria bacterium RIFCSPHIGHO2_02_FULL_43_14]|uniref:Response regulatory domain-containing protein n=1 Tax=Candidatus Zambryskibacteria bacterium RIFCSPHIGHO2_02_FULL_43_14 TaxID=1802748 RepID=A0A1G2TDZ9_9BACT|nr:MAG: hypothetical protein A2829_02695 [Candidatus Zambryskibacteria bacterium RIFCSPHIGHO2_01_FULL_43_60]OHA95524.1 MAG: hypothetical protein A3C70_00650 [Candidatus Zambryskibacteria bacterium RIFCSPHIGHO2_02_FULL_43_14]
MKILVIEDTPKHRDDAKRFFAGESGVTAIYSSDWGGAKRFLEEKGKVDGVISDIYFPYLNDSIWSEPEPVGVYVMILCRERRIPCVLNTDGNHHGKRLQWIHEMIGHLGLPAMIDTGQDKAESKNWSQAFEALKTIIAPSNHPDQK